MGGAVSPENGWLPTPNTPDGNDWRSRLIRTKHGPAPLLANANIALRSAPEWHGVLAFDEFSTSAVMSSGTPWAGGPGAITDHEDRLTADWLQHHGILVGPEIAGQAIQVVAKDRTFHPVREYLNGLKWDGVKRLDGWVNLYLGVPTSDYSIAVGRRSLIGGVARILQPGAKVDCCFILEGEQGIKKSTALKTLDSRGLLMKSQTLGLKMQPCRRGECWIIEIAELDGLTRAEVGKIKALMSRTVDRF